MSHLKLMKEWPGRAARRRLRDIESGREVVGYFTPLAPPAELIEAAGAIPFRLQQAAGPDADLRGMSALGRDSCSFCRSVLGSAILEAPPVTCIASGTACDRLRRMADAWNSATDIPYYTVAIPRTRETGGQAGILAEEFRLFARELSARTGHAVTDDGLGDAIVMGNRCRSFLMEFDQRRRGSRPTLSGAEFFATVRAAHALSSEEFLKLMDEIRAGLVDRLPRLAGAVRVLLVGPTLLDAAHDVVEIVENDCNATVVADLTDSGSLGYGELVCEGGDPFEALARQVLSHPTLTAPLKPATAFREAFLQVVREVEPDGVIYRGVPFCRPFNSEAVPLRELSPVPFLDVRVEAGGASGQLRTRIGAFLEAIEARKHLESGGAR